MIRLLALLVICVGFASGADEISSGEVDVFSLVEIGNLTKEQLVPYCEYVVQQDEKEQEIANLTVMTPEDLENTTLCDSNISIIEASQIQVQANHSAFNLNRSQYIALMNPLDIFLQLNQTLKAEIENRNRGRWDTTKSKYSAELANLTAELNVIIAEKRQYIATVRSEGGSKL